MRNQKRLFSLALAFIVPLLILWGLLMTLNSQAAPAASTDPSPTQPNALLEAIRQGKYPAQLAGHTGDIRPDRYGPQRNDPAEGIPTHAYSPFDERRNREYPCPPGGCAFQEGQVLVKLAAEVRLQRPDLKGAWTEDATLNEALQTQGVLRLEPIFPNARAPKTGEFIVSPQGERLPKPDLTRWYRAILSDDKADVYAVVQALSEAAGVAWAEPDYLRRPAEGPESKAPHPSTSAPPLLGTPTDPLYDQQWHLSATNVPQAWQWLEDNGYTPGGNRDIVVAVIDTGVDLNHPDLAANLWTNSREIPGNGRDDDGNGYVDDVHGADVIVNSGNPMDDHGHGTHVAGIIAAQANNGLGGVGVAYNVQLMPIKAAQYSGVLASSDIAEAIYYAVAQGADVINMSFGGYARSQVEEDALAVAFGQAVLVAAAGNDAKVNLPCPGGRDMYPAAYNWVLGVMASAPGGGRAGFSNYDCTPHDSHEYELMAPGVDVWSTLPNEQYAAWDGTSMATPIVSGIAALLRTKWSDKDVYSSRFIMGQIAANTAGGIGGVADAYAALTAVPQPELSYLEHWLFDTPDLDPVNDDDGIVDAGETVDLVIVIRNHWGKADPVTVTLEAWAEGAYQPDPYVTMITDTVDYGAIGSFNWDDNGLIYDDQGVIVGVRHPFRFTVDPNTPNDHVIPFRLTMTAGNGLDPADTTVYTSQSRFYLIVQRGRELPTIISEDMTLTKDYYWIVPDQTLIEAGVTVTVAEGTPVQFYSAAPSDPYASSPLAALVVQGTLRATGTFSEPVEMFLSSNYETLVTEVRRQNSGVVELRYVRMENPKVEASLIDHSFFWGSGKYQQVYYHNGQYLYTDYWHYVDTPTVNSSIFKSVGFDWYADYRNFHFAKGGGYKIAGSIDTSLVTNSYFYALIDEASPEILRNNVFLLNTRPSSRFGELRVSRLYVRNGTAGVCAGEQRVIHNAFLSNYNILDPTKWVRVWYDGSGSPACLSNNYWGTTSPVVLEAAIWDYHDDFGLGEVIHSPVLTNPVTTTYPFVVDVALSTASSPRTSIVGAEPVTFTVTFNRDMTTTVQPQVSFGPDVPYKDFEVDGDWQDPRTWVGAFNVTPITGDGYQLIRVADAVAADDPWLVTGDDVARFRFEIITSGTEAMNLQATGGEGYVDLMWTQDDFDLLAGFNLYRSTSQDGTYSRINVSIIPPDQRSFRDTNVQPGQPYYYKFTVVKTDMTESDFSNVATATPVDTIPPNISHTPVTQAPPGLPLTLYADVTDNVGVQGVTLYYRAIGATSYQSKAMVKTTGNRYSATIEGAKVASPGLEYYIEATDGISTVRDGRPEYPHQVTVVDRPVVTTVSPNHGPASGGTMVTISGSNFKAGASVTFGGAVAEDATVVSSSQITCTTPAHYPATVDVTVTNPDSQSGTLLRGFTYESEVASLSLPNTNGGQNDIVQVPVNTANVQGLAAASLTVAFDSNVLSARDASTGNLTPGWSLAANTSTPGQIRVSMASPGGTVTGSGVLAYLEFEVVGSPGASTTLQLTNVSLNDGAIPTETAAGSFQVNPVYDVGGTVRFWNGGAGVPDVLLTLDGDRVYTDQSDASGVYIVSGAETDDYALTPSKSDGVNGISAYDASLALQHDAGLTTLSGHAATAGDVNKNGSITSMDAFYILQKAVDLITLPFPGAGVVWGFAPSSRSYTNLSSDQTGQDFTAVLLGDTSGNWSAGGGSGGGWGPEIAAMQTTTATLSLPQASVLPSQQVTVPLTLNLPQGELYGADIALSYNQAVGSATAVVKGALATGWSMASNLTTPGVVRVAMAGATPITSDGELLLIVFNAVGSAGSDTDLTLTRGDLNEGGIPADLQHGNIYIARPVQAAFTASPTVGVAPLTVDFTNTSTGDFDTCAWTFGDGGTSADCNVPSYTYNSGGDYTVTLTISGTGGSDTETKVDYITVYQPPTAEFSADPTSGPASLAVSFTNLSTGDYDTCAWTFGDGGSSANCNDPGHTYTAAGVYTVTLAVSGLGGSDTETKVDYITVYQPPTAEFSGDPTSGPASLAVSFTNLSTGDYDTCAWTFGDGGTSDDCNDPGHTYTAAGVYTVTLAVSGLGGSDTETKTDYITVYQPPTAEFSADPTSGPASLAVSFTNLSTGDFDTCAWTFGDGGSSANCNDPGHTYTAAGVYTVTLAVSGLGGSDTETKVDYITVYQPPTAEFSGDPTSGPASLAVSFTNLSTGDFDTCAWTFGDGGSSANCNDPGHTYTAAGVYTVTLAVSGLGGSDTETKVDYITVYLLDISGAVRFWQGAAGVPGVLLNLQGDSAHSGTSNTAGAYTVADVSAGNYTLTPSKSDSVNGISAYDASLVLQHAAELITLTDHAATAADVNQSEIISSLDASYILQKAAELITLPFPDASVVWDFDPTSRSYTDLSSDQTDQDFTAVLLGDVSGNWSAGVGQALAQLANTASLTLPNLYAEPGERITVTLDIAVDQAEVYGADIVVSYDPAVALADSVSTGDAAQDFMTASNLNPPGMVRVAMAGAQPVTGNGHLLTLVFDVVGELGVTSPLQITAAELNEGGVIPDRRDGGIEVVDLPDYDFNRDCNVDVVDIMVVASRWRCRSGDGCYDDKYDIDKDGDIDIVDIMKVVANWGATCW